MLPEDLARALETAGSRLGVFESRVRHVATTASTNDDAARLAAEGAEEGTTVVADTQTAGRGRQGRTWFSPPGAGLYVSVVLRPPVPLQWAGAPASLLTLGLGLGLVEGLRAASGLDVAIKWPNDASVGGRKLAGILSEAFDLGTSAFHVVAGFGVNLHPAAYPPDLKERATSIEAALDRPVPRGVVLAESLAAIAARYRDLVEGRFDAILSRWQLLAPSSRGACVEWVRAGVVETGVTAGLDRDGALLVRTAAGIERVVGGEIRWR